MRIAHEEASRISEIVIQPRAVGILFDSISVCSDVVISARELGAGKIRSREIRAHFGGNRVDTVGRNHIIRERVANETGSVGSGGLRIVDHDLLPSCVQGATKITGEFGWARLQDRGRHHPGRPGDGECLELRRLRRSRERVFVE